MALKQNWFVKYKLYHIPFWMLYNYIFWALQINSPSQAVSTIFFSSFFIKYFFYVIFPAFAVYFNLYFLIPKYLEHGKYITYLLWLTATIIIASALIVPGYYITSYINGGTVRTIYGVMAEHPFYELFKGDPLRTTIACTTLAMSIKLTKNWIETQRRQRLLEKEKLETELTFLKYQFNPHFLFNSINSIFFLIHKNPDMASASLAKFSELLRHQLYECNEAQIPLVKEIAYLENFIELEKLRQNPDLEVSFTSPAIEYNDLEIAPFILMTFVENAFKHVSKDKGAHNWIKIDLHVKDLKLYGTIANSTSKEKNVEVINYGGIGLKNVQRRLDLIYPDNYKLNISDAPENFEVSFALQLSAPLVVTNTKTMERNLL